MKIAGLEKCSFVDFPSKLAAVVFTAGCNWSCFYCHNRQVARNHGAGILDESQVLTWLETRRGLLDAVVLSGGEATLQPRLVDFVRMVKAMGFAAKLDTNGTRPEVLRTLLGEGLLDYVAMDIKAPMAQYETFCGARVDHDAVNQSIDLLLLGDVDYEFRTTVVPQLSESDVIAIARRIMGARRFVLQQYRRPAIESQDPRLDVWPHEPSWPRHVLGELKTLVRCVETRGFEAVASENTVRHSAQKTQQKVVA